MSHLDIEYLRRELKEASASVETPWSGYLLGCCLLLLIAFIAWSAWAQINEVTRGEGQVIPSSREQSIQSLEGGILGQLLVSEGQVVEKGEVLAILDETRFRTAYLESSSQATTLRVTIARLEAEVLGMDALVIPTDIAMDDSQVATEQQLFNARQTYLRESADAINQESSALRQQLRMLQGLSKRGAIGKLEMLKTQSQLAELQGRLTELHNTFIQDAYSDLAAKKSELVSLQQIIEQRRDQLTRTQLKAPLRGVINNISIATQGGVIQPGEEIMQITPLEEHLIFETRIRPQDIAFLAPGMTATIKISAYDYTVYGDLHGQVERVSSDTLSEQTPKGEETYYKVLISTPDNHLNHNGLQLPIKPGMLAQIDIQTGQRSVLQYLLRPLTMLELR
jgi:adhesin transport system membrane fusion protein